MSDVEQVVQLTVAELEGAIDDMYVRRQTRAVDPDGKFDNAGRWYPSESEECICCHQVRSPSRNWPYSYLLHCRTRRHITNLLIKRNNAG